MSWSSFMLSVAQWLHSVNKFSPSVLLVECQELQFLLCPFFECTRGCVLSKECALSTGFVRTFTLMRAVRPPYGVLARIAFPFFEFFSADQRNRTEHGLTVFHKRLKHQHRYWDLGHRVRHRTLGIF